MICRKIYTFHVNNNLILCAVFYIITLNFINNVFYADSVTFLNKMFSLRIKSGLWCQIILWTEDKLNSSVFMMSNKREEEAQNASDQTLIYSMYYCWLKHLEAETNFIQILMIYYLCCTIENTVNDELFSNAVIEIAVQDNSWSNLILDDSIFNSVICNLVMNYSDNIIFKCNYLLCMI